MRTISSVKMGTVGDSAAPTCYARQTAERAMGGDAEPADTSERLPKGADDEVDIMQHSLCLAAP